MFQYRVVMKVDPGYGEYEAVANASRYLKSLDDSDALRQIKTATPGDGDVILEVLCTESHDDLLSFKKSCDTDVFVETFTRLGGSEELSENLP